MEKIKAFIQKTEEVKFKKEWLSKEFVQTIFSTGTFREIKNYADEMLQLGGEAGIENLHEMNGEYHVLLSTEKFFEVVTHDEISNAYTKFAEESDILYETYHAKKEGLFLKSISIEFAREKKLQVQNELEAV